MYDFEKRDTPEVSYLTLRKIVGILGVSLPIVVAVWGLTLYGTLLPSISDYYKGRTGDAFVGILFVAAWFLFTYKGYEPKDDIAGDLACLFGLGVALFPNSGTPWEARIHFLSAAGFFLVLSYFAMFLFTKSKSDPTPRKKLRNAIYRTCGVVMLSCIVLIGLFYLFFEESDFARFSPVFWLETFALWGFGISWFIKGETLFQDQAG
ncbi:MAG TPA: DUF998 domain-containing protein [Acidobacteriota bacterium]|nr:DUF998 domain-containing protein [Acidobacteriota bacterium]